MLTAGKYRYVVFEAAEGGKDAEIYNFRLGERFKDDDLAAGWNDVV
jgi:hypothetical protein